MTNLYAIGVTIHATAYVKAANEGEALAAAHNDLRGNAIYLPDNVTDLFSGANFDSPDLPKVSLSPAMTVVEKMHRLACQC